MRRLAAALTAALLVACADSTAPVNRVPDCSSDPGACPPPAPKDSAYVCRVSMDAAGNVTGEWCGWIPVTP